MLYLYLLACAGEKITTTDTAAPAGDSAADTAGSPDDSAADDPSLDPVQPSLVAVGSVGVGDLEPSFAGYSFAGVADGFAWTATAEGIVYVCSPTAVGDVADICEARWSGQEWSIDKIARDGALLSVADALGAGIAYTVADGSAGALGDVYETRVDGAYPEGYAGTSLHIDADGDGDEDDLAVTTSLDGSIGWSGSPDYYGEIAVFLDALAGAWVWGEADHLLPACADAETIAFGPTQIVSDGDVLYAGCPATGYGDGAVEGWALPLTSRPADWVALGPSGWYLAGRPEGGVYADARREGGVYAIRPDGDHLLRAVDIGGDLDGAGPATLTTSEGRTYIAIGSQPRSSTGLAPVAGAGEWPWQVRSLDAGTPGPRAAEGGFYGAIMVCDITGGDWDARLCATAELPDDSYATCTGAVQALVEIDGEVYVSSSGWVYGSGDGCGTTTWRIE